MMVGGFSRWPAARRLLGAAALAGGLAASANGDWWGVNLHPAGPTSSKAHGVHAGQQVGYVGNFRARLWSGSAGSWVNLHAYLPANYSGSSANGIWHDESGFTYVVGSAYDSTAGRDEALIWVLPEPGSALALSVGLASLALLGRRRKKARP